MRRSIRGRLQAWYALVLLAVVAGFAGILFFQLRAARFHEIDAGLTSAAQYLEVGLRRFPPAELNGPPPFAGEFPGPRPPDRPGLPYDRPGPREFDRPGRREFDRPGPPPFDRPGPPELDRPERRPPLPVPADRDRMLAELQLPRGLAPEGDDRSAAPYFAVWRTNGTLLKALDRPDGLPPPAPPELPLSPVPRLTQRGELREAALVGPSGTRILVGRSVAREQSELRAFAWRLAGIGAVVLAVGLAGGWFVSARILRPVAAISATASSISGTNLSERIDPAGVDRELAGLADVLNAMFDRLEAAFARQVRFTADVSHELRTPLAVIRSHAELALNRPRSGEEYRDALDTCLRSAGRMTELVEALLTLARADAGKLDLRHEPVELRELVAESVALFRPLAQGKDVSLATRLAPVEVPGDAGRLSQVVMNLLSNAVQYNRPGGEVRVALAAEADTAVLSVSDTGCGIPAEDRPHLFERFYRVDKARARASGGNGLGLSICQSIVEAHGGTVGCESVVGRGSTFWVRLPLRTAEGDPQAAAC